MALNNKRSNFKSILLKPGKHTKSWLKKYTTSNIKMYKVTKTYTKSKLSKWAKFYYISLKNISSIISLGTCNLLGRLAQSVGLLTHKSGVLGSIPGLATYFRSPSAFSRRAVVSYWRKCVHEVLVNCVGGLSRPRKSVVRLTDHPDMTLDVYRGRKTIQQQ